MEGEDTGLGAVVLSCSGGVSSQVGETGIQQ